VLLDDFRDILDSSPTALQPLNKKIYGRR